MAGAAFDRQVAQEACEPYGVLHDSVPDDGGAGSAVSERALARVPGSSSRTLKVERVYIIPDAAVTADDTNFATVKVHQRASGGGSQTTVAQQTTKTSGSGGSGNWTAFAPVQLTLQSGSSNADLTGGQSLTVEVTKSGTGVDLPEFEVQVEYRMNE